MKFDVLENQIFGVDLMPDNVQRCIERLFGPGKIEEVTDEAKRTKLDINHLDVIVMHFNDELRK